MSELKLKDVEKVSKTKIQGYKPHISKQIQPKKKSFCREQHAPLIGFFFTPGKCAGTHKTLALGAYAAMNWVGTASLDEHRSDRS